MPLSVGDRLGPYEIAALIGAGGMGEVYRARDTRLGRDVAIKTSAEKFSERFEREARSIAALNHPNICILHDVGPNYLVMELIEGPTLADRIKQGAIPLEESLKVAKQIADALEAAHEKGIVHRDLKPANIKITAEGSVKVLDFGLAKAGGTVDVSASPEVSPTISMAAATEAGVILGTAAYMSPEQARGKAVDKRADIWAFGVVLYEMITGKRLFQGEDLTETLASVVKEKPDLSGVPAKVRQLLERCLEKDPKKRLRDIGDAWGVLEDVEVGEGHALPSEMSSQGVALRHAKLAWILAALLVVALGIALWAPWRSEKPVDRPLVRLDVDLGSQVALPPLSNSIFDVLLSRDGTRLVYVSGDPPRLYTRRLDQSQASELPGTEGAFGAFFSPDGQWVGFYNGAGKKLEKISVEGGAVVPIADLGYYAGASWGTNGDIILGGAITKGLIRLPASGAAPNTVLDLDAGEFAYASPQILPDGKAVLFAAFRTTDVDSANIEVFSFGDRRRKTLVRGSTFACYLPSGHLVYVSKGTLFAIPFDLAKLETRGTAVPVLYDLSYGQFGNVDVDFAATGTLVYRRGSGGGGLMKTIQWVDRTGKKETLLAKPGVYQNVLISPDGKRLSFVVSEGANQDVWVYDIRRDAMTRLTSGGGPYSLPVWSPDGRYIVFGSFAKGMFWTRADGAGQPQPLIQSKSSQFPLSMTPDGKRLAYTDGTNEAQIWTVPLEEQGGQLKAGKPEQFIKSQSSDHAPTFSPDGHWLAYASDESGKSEVFVRAFPPAASGQGGKWQISNSGGFEPFWSRARHELLYQAGQAGERLMAVNYSVKGDSFVAEKPREWIEKLPGTDIDLAPDGKRVAVVTPVDAPAAPKTDHEVTFLFNFFDELRRRAPVGK
jgi:hypothetical protein